MERKQGTKSVISQLMGINDHQSNQVPRRSIRVLSEDYLRKSAALALLEKSAVCKSCLPKKTAEKHHGTDHMFGNSVRAQSSFKRQEKARVAKQSKVDSGYISTRIPKPKSKNGSDWLRKISDIQTACKRYSNVGPTEARNTSSSRTTVRNSEEVLEVSCQKDSFDTPSAHNFKIRSANDYLKRLASRTKAINSSVAHDTSVRVSQASQQKLYTRTALESISVKNSRDTSQLSPDSVLEPTFFEEEDRESELSDSPMLEPSGLAMKLLLLNNESEDTSLEGSVMSVSTDKDSEERSDDLSQDYEKLWRPWKPDESRDFSYLIDVLDEATLFGLDLDTLCETFQEEEYPLSPLVFKRLEKKYGKQTSWLKSERRLMFDYVNSGLKAIQGSYMDCKLSKLPLKQRFCAASIKGDIEEELWMQFARQKEAKKDSPEKGFLDQVQWMELEDDVSTICKDIAEVLFDELAVEILHD